MLVRENIPVSLLIAIILTFQDWELLVLSRLKWDLSAITPNDFLEQILSRLHMDAERARVMKRHAQTFIALCATGKNTFCYFSSPFQLVVEYLLRWKP